jgi:hypothetical protein
LSSLEKKILVFLKKACRELYKTSGCKLDRVEVLFSFGTGFKPEGLYVKRKLKISRSLQVWKNTKNYQVHLFWNCWG